MEYRIWCRLGTLPVAQTERDAAIGYAVRYASKNGVYVILVDRDDTVIAEIPPALQSSMIVPLYFTEDGRDLFTDLYN